MIKYMIWLFLGAVFLSSPFIGAVSLNMSDIMDPSTTASDIFFDIRLPRVMFAAFAGVILSLGGLLFQTLFRNALMTPYTLGISSGAVLGAGVGVKLGVGMAVLGISLINILGFFGALVSLFVLFYMSRFLKSRYHESLLLLGIALSLFYTSALMILFYLGDAVQNDMLIRFTMGSLSVIGWKYTATASVAALLVLAALYVYRFELQLLSTCEESARVRGVETKKVSIILLGASSVAVGLLVSISGPIGFVGLITPHIISMLHPSSINGRILKTALFGALFLVFCDTIARTPLSHSEIPIGIITALLGGPFFIYLIIRKKQ